MGKTFDPVKKRKSAEDLLQEVEQYDKVVVPWIGLAEALNTRLDRTFLGLFAGTATQHLSTGKTMDEEQLFLHLYRETDLDWRQADFLLRRVSERLEDGQPLDSIIEDERFQGDLIAEAVSEIRDTENILTVRKDGEIEGDVAVIRPGMMTELDRMTLPEGYDEIELLSEEIAEEPEMHIFSSTGEIATAIAESLTEEDAGDVAVVAHRDSRYRRLTSNMLEAKDIPVQKGEMLGNDERVFLNLCELAVTDGRIFTKSVKPLAERLGIQTSGRYLKEEQREQIRELLNVSDYLTFEELLDGYTDIYSDKPEIRKVLKQTGLNGAEINRSSIRMLEKALEKSLDDGVKMLDPSEAIFVDRQTVFYLGVSAEWSQSEGEVMSGEEFELMIQNGSSRYFMVQEYDGGEKVTPALQLEQLFDRQDFREFDHEKHTVKRSGGQNEREFTGEHDEIEVVSQTDLNLFHQSPRAYYFSQLVSDETEKQMVRGNLLHQYSEYIFSNGVPEEEEEFIELMIEEIKPHMDMRQEEMMRTEFRIGVNALNSLHDRLDWKEFEHSLISTEGDENIFAEKFGGKADSSITETYFRDENLGIKGKIDLMPSADHLLDIKISRSIRSKKDIVTESLPDIETDRKDFQPMIYLLKSIEDQGEREIRFSYFFTHGELRKDLRNEDSFSEKMVTVEYRPWTFEEEFKGSEIFEYLIRGVKPDNDRRKTLEKLTLPEFRSFFTERDPELRDEEKVMEEVLPEFEEYVKKRVGDYSYVEKGCRSAMKKIVEYRLSNFYTDDMERFRGFIEDSIDSINCYRAEGFPSGEVDSHTPFREMIVDGAE